MNFKKDSIKPNDDQYLSFKSESNNDIDSNMNKPIPIYKVINIIDMKFYNTYIKSKYTRIVKLKKMTLTTQKLHKIYIDL